MAAMLRWLSKAYSLHEESMACTARGTQDRAGVAVGNNTPHSGPSAAGYPVYTAVAKYAK